VLRQIAEHKYTPALQVVAFFFGGWTLLRIGSNQPIVSLVISEFSDNLLFRYAFIADFMITFILSLVFSHIVFFRTLFASDDKKPRWHLPIMRSIDYIWYLGSAYGALLIVASFQAQYARNEFENLKGYDVAIHGMSDPIYISS
jgi:hypothetical protein